MSIENGIASGVLADSCAIERKSRLMSVKRRKSSKRKRNTGNHRKPTQYRLESGYGLSRLYTRRVSRVICHWRSGNNSVPASRSNATIDAIHNKAAIGLSVAGAPGFQFLDLGTSSFEPAFASPAGRISEDPLFDPTRNLLLSATEINDFEIVDVATSTSPAFFENRGIPSEGELDSSAEECTTGIALAPAEFSGPSHVFIADLTQATFTAGSPGTWTAPSQVQSLSESFLAAGPSGSAVAQGTHTGVVTGEFGGKTLTAIALPATSGSGTPAIGDWVTCAIGSSFSNGFDPHTVTAYQSPNTGDAIAALANGGATILAVVDLTQMLNPTIVPRTGAGHGCASGTLPATVVSFITVP